MALAPLVRRDTLHDGDSPAVGEGRRLGFDPVRPDKSPGASLVGDHRWEETPVPIPNTEVKLLPPMILLSGKVGRCRRYGSRRVTPGGVLYFAALDGPAPRRPINRIGRLTFPRLG